MKKLLLGIFLFSTPAFCQTVTVVDNSTISVAQAPTTVSISQLKRQLDLLNQREVSIENDKQAIQAQIDSAAQQGAADAVPLATKNPPKGT